MRIISILIFFVRKIREKSLRNGGLFWWRVALVLSVSIEKELKHYGPSSRIEVEPATRLWIVLSRESTRFRHSAATWYLFEPPVDYEQRSHPSKAERRRPRLHHSSNESIQRSGERHGQTRDVGARTGNDTAGCTGWDTSPRPH